MDLRLDGRTAVVTGAASGIGAATARRLAREGAMVVAADVNLPGATDVADDIGGLPIHLDVTDAVAVREQLELAARTIGPIDLLVNNAGGGEMALFLDTDEREWHRILQVNLIGTMSCTHAVLASMYERRQGAIVNISSEAGHIGTPAGAAYSAAKAGVIGFTKALAREAARYDVRVNAVAPGTIETPLVAGGAWETPFGSRLKQGMIAATSMGRSGDVDEVAGVIAFLASDDAAYMTGQTIAVSGGLSMQ